MKTQSRVRSDRWFCGPVKAAMAVWPKDALLKAVLLCCKILVAGVIFGLAPVRAIEPTQGNPQTPESLKPLTLESLGLSPGEISELRLRQATAADTMESSKVLILTREIFSSATEGAVPLNSLEFKDLQNVSATSATSVSAVRALDDLLGKNAPDKLTALVLQTAYLPLPSSEFILYECQFDRRKLLSLIRPQRQMRTHSDRHHNSYAHLGLKDQMEDTFGFALAKMFFASGETGECPEINPRFPDEPNKHVFNDLRTLFLRLEFGIHAPLLKAIHHERLGDLANGAPGWLPDRWVNRAPHFQSQDSARRTLRSFLEKFVVNPDKAPEMALDVPKEFYSDFKFALTRLMVPSSEKYNPKIHAKWQNALRDQTKIDSVFKEAFRINSEERAVALHILDQLNQRIVETIESGVLERIQIGNLLSQRTLQMKNLAQYIQAGLQGALPEDELEKLGLKPGTKLTVVQILQGLERRALNDEAKAASAQPLGGADAQRGGAGGKQAAATAKIGEDVEINTAASSPR